MVWPYALAVNWEPASRLEDGVCNELREGAFNVPEKAFDDGQQCVIHWPD